MAKILGIDLGTTYSCVAYIDENNKPVVLKNAEGNLTTPSVVFFESETDVTVGDAAKENAKMYPEHVVSFIKRNMGEENFSLNINGSDMRPEEISSYILKKIVNDATEALRDEGKLDVDEDIKDVVITVPAYFGNAEREATITAGKIAGLNVLNTINEPTAAAITYGVINNNENRTVMVYDLGGGTFDITIISINKGEIHVICTGGDNNLGGKDWDDRIVMHLVEEFKKECPSVTKDIFDDLETLQELYISAEKAKKLLSSKEKAPITVNFAGERVRYELTREKFEEITSDLLLRTISMSNSVIEDAKAKGVDKSQISEILLVGGSSRMPQVAKAVREEIGIETKMFDPDEAVAKGAALYAENISNLNIIIEKTAINTGKTVEQVKQDIESGATDISKLGGSEDAFKPVKIINVTSRSYGTGSYTGPAGQEVKKLFNLIKVNMELPAYGEDIFCPRHDNQETVRFTVYESLSSDEITELSDGKLIGDALLKLPPNTPKTAQIKTVFKINETGLLEIKATELKSGNTVEAQFQTTSSMSEDELADAIRKNSASNVN